MWSEGGVTFLVGLQYVLRDPPLTDPHGLWVRTSFHFSAVHRLRDAPFLPLRTTPCAFRHFATYGVSGVQYSAGHAAAPFGLPGHSATL